MAKPKKTSGNIGGTVGVVAGIVAAVTPLAVELIDRIPRKDDNGSSEELILVPELCSKKFPLKLDEAKQLLENCGLKVLPTEVRLRDASIKYKDCFDLQVVGSNKKSNAKVKPGETIVIQYVTQEVITESLRIFEEAEMQKAALKQERAAKHAEHIEQAKILAGDVAMKARDGIAKVVARKSKKKESEKENSYEQE